MLKLTEYFHLQVYCQKKDNAAGWLSLCSYVFMPLLEQIVKEVLFSFLNVSFYWAIHTAVVTTY